MVGHWSARCILAVCGMRYAEKGLQTVDGAVMKECEEMAEALASALWHISNELDDVPNGRAMRAQKMADTALAAYRAARRATEES